MGRISSKLLLKPFLEKTQLVNVVIDTPKASPFKLKFDEEFQVFRVHKAMPVGFVFPFNFGFVPSTRGGDGDPLDVLLLTDHIMPIGTVVRLRHTSVGRRIGARFWKSSGKALKP